MPMGMLKDSNAVTLSGTVLISGTCGLTLGAAPDYGTLAPGGTSSEPGIGLTITNTGTAVGTLSVSGTDWVSGGISHIAVGGTHFAFTPPAAPVYASKTPLTTTPTAVPGVIWGTNATVWQLKATLINTPFSGTLTQTMTFSMAC